MCACMDASLYIVPVAGMVMVREIGHRSLLNELFLVVTVIIFESNILLSKDCRSLLFQYVLSNFPVLNLYLCDII